MVFSSTPLYLDPHNWHHHQQQGQIHQHQQQSQPLSSTTTTHGGGGGGSGGDNNNPAHHQSSVHMPPPVIPSQAIGGGTASSIRPGSMAERARQAKIPQPEPGLKCPRCQSTNTKFCYFNNYSLTQPRHFCKMCRRYWTKGGALRNVPVGGGFRKNNKRSSNKGGGGVSKAMGEHQAAGTDSNHNSASPISSSSNNTDTNNNFNHIGNIDSSTSLAGQSFQPRMTHFPLLASLQGLNHHGQYGSPTSANNLGPNFGGMMSPTAQAELGFQIGSSVSSVNADHQWRPNHFPNNFLAAFDPTQFSHRPSSSSLYHFPIGQLSLDQQATNNLVPPRSSSFSTSINQHLAKPSSMPLKNSTDQRDNEAAAAVKAEEAAAASQAGMNSHSRSFLGMSDNSGQYWNANDNNTNTTTWTDLSGINTSSTTDRLL